MAYTPTEWKDRVVEHPRTYTIQDNGDGTITLTPEPGTIYEPGTPVSAPNMNKIEQGLVDAHNHIARTDNPHAVTKAQVGLGNVQNYGIASQAQAEAGSANNVYMTPLSTKQYVDTRLLNNLKFRLNSGQLEYEDGGTWKPVGDIQVGRTRTASVSSVGTSYTTVLDVSGVPGKLYMVYLLVRTSVVATNVKLRVTIDGVSEVVEAASLSSSSILEYFADEGGGNTIHPKGAYAPITFYNSLKVEAQAASQGSQIDVFVEYALKAGTP